jgi:phosphoglycerate dehydrogenase-like enzyme
VSGPLGEAAHDAQALVVWGTSRRVLAQATTLPELRWVADLAAGPDRVLSAGFAPRVLLTHGVGLHDATVTEHTVALVLACLRHLPALVRAQDEHRWAGDLGGVQALHPTGSVRTLIGSHVVVWGFGSIAARLAPVLTALGARVTGVARTAGTRAGCPVVTAAQVGAELADCDVLVGLLPGTAATRHLLDAHVLGQLPPRAFVVNVGRGSTLDEAALLDAVRSGSLAGAALDVFETEPLPADSPLWGEPRVLISPHAAGGRPVGADELVSDNLGRLVAGRPLRNLIHA